MASMIAPNEPFYACMAHKGVGATQMTGLLQGVTNGALDIQYTYIICRLQPIGMRSAA